MTGVWMFGVVMKVEEEKEKKEKQLRVIIIISLHKARGTYLIIMA